MLRIYVFFMSAFDFFFPEQAQASHLRSLVQQKRYEYMNDQREKADLREDLRCAEKHMKRMGQEMAETQLLIKGMMELMEEAGVFDSARLMEKIKEIDLRDGVEDGRITPVGSRPKRAFVPRRKWGRSD